MANLTNSAKLIEEMEKKINAADVSKVWKSNKYSDLDWKPTIPTVNNSTITIQKNGSNVDSFTTNASDAKTINIQLAKADVGLWNVDNTSDANKPISNATQTALNAKANSADVYTKADVDSAITSAVSSVYKYKGSVANYSALASKTWMVTWDVWNTEDTNMNYAWTWTAWDPLWATVDLSWYVTTSTLNTELAKKQDSITSTNKLSADLIADWTTNKVVTSTEKTTWNNKQNALNTNQLSAVNSWITADKVSTYDWYATTIWNKVNTSDVLIKTNTTAFTPTWDYQPATKKYVDDKSAAVMTEAQYWQVNNPIAWKIYFIKES